MHAPPTRTCRHAEAAGALARAHALCDAGSQEQRECRQQLLACVGRLTRSELSGGLLLHMAPHRHASVSLAAVEAAAQRAGCRPAEPESSQGDLQAGPKALPACSQQGADPQPPGQQAAGAVVQAAGDSLQQAACLVSSTGPGDQLQEAAEELLEGMFEVVREAAAKQQQAKAARSSASAGSSAAGASPELWDLRSELAGWQLAAAGSADQPAPEWRCHQLWAQLHLKRRAPLLAVWHLELALALLRACTVKVCGLH